MQPNAYNAGSALKKVSASGYVFFAKNHSRKAGRI
jgi:hypothetical protein